MEILRDPQDFCEKLFSRLRRTNERFEVRILMMALISRLIASHSLLLPSFYPFLQKYMQPHQKYCTQILALGAQASHNLVDPDVLSPLVRSIANHFISDRCSNEEMTVGLNTVREIFMRAPLCLSGPLL